MYVDNQALIELRLTKQKLYRSMPDDNIPFPNRERESKSLALVERRLRTKAWFDCVNDSATSDQALLANKGLHNSHLKTAAQLSLVARPKPILSVEFAMQSTLDLLKCFHRDCQHNYRSCVKRIKHHLLFIFNTAFICNLFFVTEKDFFTSRNGQ